MLSIGSRLGPYAIQSPIGSGGMGEVYRARDTKLNRDGVIGAGGMGEVYRALDINLGRQVAIKVLPDSFAHDPSGWRASSGKRRQSPH
jgi:serine/threonine protein kinase